MTGRHDKPHFAFVITLTPAFEAELAEDLDDDQEMTLLELLEKLERGEPTPNQPVPLDKKRGIWEVKKKLAGQEIRALCYRAGNHLVMLCAFSKKAQKTPMKYMTRAKKRASAWQTQQEEG